jgi:hypothetical protein
MTPFSGKVDVLVINALRPRQISRQDGLSCRPVKTGAKNAHSSWQPTRRPPPLTANVSRPLQRIRCASWINIKTATLMRCTVQLKPDATDEKWLFSNSEYQFLWRAGLCLVHIDLKNCCNYRNLSNFQIGPFGWLISWSDFHAICSYKQPTSWLMLACRAS